MTCPMSLNRFRALYSAKRARFGDLGDATEEIYNQATRAGKGLEELFTTGGYETPVLGDRGDAASSYYAPKQGQYSEGGSGSTGNDYGPSAADCEAAGAAYDAATGQCVSKTPTAGGTQFKPVPTEEIPDGGEEDLPPWVREGIAKCQLEDKLFDAATGECVDDPDASKDQPRRTTGGGYTGGPAKKKKTDDDEPWSKAYVVGLSALSGAVATGVAATATSLAMKGKHTAAVGAGGALLGALAGGVLAFAISDR